MFSIMRTKTVVKKLDNISNIINDRLNELENKLQRVCKHNNYNLEYSSRYIKVQNMEGEYIYSRLLPYFNFTCKDCGYKNEIRKGNPAYNKFLKEYKTKKEKELRDLK